jgi:ketosteroid isomerase-like protein
VTDLWETELAAWDYLKTGNLKGYLSLLHDDVTAWPRHTSTPIGKDGIIQHTLAMISALQAPGVTIEFQPLSVRIFNNVGIAQYQANIRGTVPSLNQKLRFTRTWLLTETGWKLIAGMNASIQ